MYHSFQSIFHHINILLDVILEREIVLILLTRFYTLS